MSSHYSKLSKPQLAQTAADRGIEVQGKTADELKADLERWDVEHPETAPEPTEPEAPSEPTRSVEDEVRDRAQLVAQSEASGIADARAAEEAKVARARAAGSADAEQKAVELRLAELLDEKAARFDEAQRVTDRNRGARGRAASRVTGLPASSEPVPRDLHIGDVVRFHTAHDVPDQHAWILRIHGDQGDNRYWLADLYAVPVIEGSSASTVTNVSYGPGDGQFSKVPEGDDDYGLKGRTFEQVRTWRHE